MRRQHAKSYFCRLLSVWVSRLAGLPRSGFINKDLIGFWYDSEVHFIFVGIFSLPRVIFLSGSQYFTLILFKKNDTQSLYYHHFDSCLILLLFIPLGWGWGSLKQDVCLHEVFCFKKAQYVFSNAISFCLI